MKTAIVNGTKISPEAVAFELERLVRFYRSHGMGDDEIRGTLTLLRDKALEQAIGAKLLLDKAENLDMKPTAAEIDAEVAKVVAQIGSEEEYRKALAAQGLSEENFRAELAKGAKVNKLVAQALAHVEEPSEQAVADFYAAHRTEYSPRTLVDAHDEIKDLLRHDLRGKAMNAYIAELREGAKIEYVK